MLVPYRRISTNYFDYKELNNLTGRWKISKNKYGDIKMFIEIKHLFFNIWVSEDEIIWKEDEWEIINECGCRT